jgi:hypothetical protein
LFGQAKPPARPAPVSAEVARLRAENDSLRRELNRLKTPAVAAVEAPPPPRASTSSSVIDLIPAPLPDKHRGEISVEYDRFKDHTVVHLKGIKIPGTMRMDDLDVSSFYIMDGKSVKPPSIAVLIIRSSNKDWEYLRCHDLSILADDERVNIGEADHSGSVGSGYVLESVSTMMPVTSLLQIARAAKVEAQLCTTRFKLGYAELLAFRDFANRMRPAP